MSVTSERVAQPEGSTGFQWTMAVIALLLVGGSALDNWAHFHGKVDQSFFTPWHAVLYGMMALTGVVLGSIALRNVHRGYDWRHSLPSGYMLSLAGVGLFILAGLLDLAWHLKFGIEFDTAAFVSPTHLLLLGTGLLAGTGPLRAAWLTLAPASARGWRTLGPLAICAASTVAAIAVFTQIASPMIDTPSAKNSTPIALPSATGQQAIVYNANSAPGRDLQGVEQAFGVAEVVVQTVLLMSMALLLLHTWAAPFGTMMLVIGLPSAVQALMVDNYWLIAAAVATGLIADLIASALRPPARGAAFYTFACLLPAVYMFLYFLVIDRTSGLAWPITLTLGCVAYAAGTGLFLSFLLDWPISSPAASR